jgi:hypothetical protein
MIRFFLMLFIGLSYLYILLETSYGFVIRGVREKETSYKITTENDRFKGMIEVSFCTCLIELAVYVIMAFIYMLPSVISWTVVLFLMFIGLLYVARFIVDLKRGIISLEKTDKIK